jgi:hypothetical protein
MKAGKVPRQRGSKSRLRATINYKIFIAGHSFRSLDFIGGRNERAMSNLGSLISLFVFAIGIFAFYRWMSDGIGTENRKSESRW